jgi:hypothetical protein
MSDPDFNDVVQWLDFITKMSVPYPNFLPNMEKIHSDVKGTKLKVCAMLVCDCKTNEILKKEPNTIDHIRSELWQEFNLEGHEELIPYLKKLAAIK